MASELKAHSPLPWIKSDRGVAAICAVTGGNVIVNCGAWGNNTHDVVPEQEANAELICTAVNSHEALVTALKAAHEDMLDLNEYWNGMNGSAVDACQHTCEVSEKAMNAIYAALRAAGVKE